MRGAILVGAVLLAGGCNHKDADDGPRVSRNVQVGAFEKLAVAGSYEVVVTVGGAPGMRVEGASKRVDRMEVSVEGGTLRIREKEKHGGFSFFTRDRAPVRVYITSPGITAASIAGSGDVRIDKVNGGDFRGNIAGSGDLQIGQMQARRADFSIAGSGSIRASGKAEEAEYQIAGSGDISAGGLEARRAKVSVAGSGNVEGRAMESADIEIMGSGDVSITGTAKCNIEKKGSGEARCGG